MLACKTLERQLSRWNTSKQSSKWNTSKPLDKAINQQYQSYRYYLKAPEEKTMNVLKAFVKNLGLQFFAAKTENEQSHQYLRYDASTEDKQYVWKNMIINFIERYFYIICFATYAREHVRRMFSIIFCNNGFLKESSGFSKSFVTWMDEHKELREMIENGKDRLEWTRKVDQSQVGTTEIILIIFIISASIIFTIFIITFTVLMLIRWPNYGRSYKETITSKSLAGWSVNSSSLSKSNS